MPLIELAPPELPETNHSEMQLLAISPVDGRYSEKSSALNPFLSEFALIRSRIFVETELIKAYAGEEIISPLTDYEINILDSLTLDFSLEDALQIKEIEKKSDHDVVAGVNFIKIKLKEKNLGNLAEYVHLGPTSEDIDNLAIRLNLNLAQKHIVLPKSDKLINTLVNLAKSSKNIPLIGRTHGQPASPTTFGKEMINFAARLTRQRDQLSDFRFQGKFNGMIGTFSGFRAAFPEKSLEWWTGFSEKFVKNMGFDTVLLTTQGNPNDDLAEYLQIYQRFNNILHGLNSDIWDYISRKELKQKITGSGSSTGAAKINPWRAEHAQAMGEMANAQINVLVNNIAESRLDRDLSDKTLMRFLGEIIAVNLNSWEYTEKQLSIIETNRDKMENTIYTDLSFLSEALQLILRKNRIEDAYEKIRAKTQGKEFSTNQWSEMIKKLINELKLTEEKDKDLIIELLSLNPRPLIDNATSLTQTGINTLQNKN